MLKLINNGLEIKNNNCHAFIQKPQNRTIYVDEQKYQVPLPFLIFSIDRFKIKSIIAFKHFMVKDNEIKYNNDNPPHQLPLPNQTSYANFCLGEKVNNLKQLIQSFYQTSFISNELTQAFPNQLKNYQPFINENFKFTHFGNKFIIHDSLLKIVTKHLMDLSIQRNSMLYEELIITKHHYRLNELL